MNESKLLMLFGYRVDQIESTYYLVASNIVEALEDANILAGDKMTVNQIFIVSNMIHIDFAREVARIDKEFKGTP